MIAGVGKKILCVEDEQDIRENIVDILCDEGFEVFEADNGRTGFESFVENKPDLVISDIMMPEVDGYGLLAMIRDSKEVRDNMVPFIFLSALGQKSDIIKGLGLSANDYMVKPIDFDLLIAKIKTKLLNASKLNDQQRRDINNIKDQFSGALSSNVFSYLDVIGQIAEILKTEPYGPLPHRYYMRDFNRLHANILKLRVEISNALDGEIIDKRISSSEEVVNIADFFNDFTNGLNDDVRKAFILDDALFSNSLPKVKMDRFLMLDILNELFATLSNLDQGFKVRISALVDHLDRLILIFYIDSAVETIILKGNLENLPGIKGGLANQSSSFDIFKREGSNSEDVALITIPPYRLLEK